MADEFKAKGNSAFSSGQFEEAIRHFSDAIALAPDNHVLYSNRSASYASIHNFSDALSDAKRTVEINPRWAKGYSRLGASYVGLGNFKEAVQAYEKGLEIDPNNEPLKSGLADATASLEAKSRGPSASSPFANMFQGPEVWAKLAGDPSTRAYLQQPDFVKMMQDLQKNPNNINMYLSDQRMMQSLGVLLNVNMKTADNMERDFPEEKETTLEQEKLGKPAKPAKTEPEAAPEPEPMNVPEEEKLARDKKNEAQKEKEMGNASYKKKDFEVAIQHYSRALELYDEDISFLTNKAAVYFEMGKVLSDLIIA